MDKWKGLDHFVWLWECAPQMLIFTQIPKMSKLWSVYMIDCYQAIKRHVEECYLEEPSLS